MTSPSHRSSPKARVSCSESRLIAPECPDDVTLAPKLSEGTSKLLWILRPIAPDCPPHHLIAPLITGKLVQKQERKGSIAERLLSWGEQHKRGEGDASLADRKYKFGGDEPPAPAPV